MQAADTGDDAQVALAALAVQEPVRGVLFDVDGVLRVDGQVLPGAASTLATLRQHAIPFHLLTNTTTRARATLGTNLRGLGLDVTDDQIVTAGLATAQYLRHRHPGARVLPIVTGDVLADFDGIVLTDTSDADVVVIGGAEDAFTWAALNTAFRALRNGATLIAMQRGLSWMTSAGPALDAGAFIVGLERATGQRARVVGKPATPFFRSGLRGLGLPPAQVLMVGDDATDDIRPALRMGMRAALVRTGIFDPRNLDRVTPTWVIDAVADVPGLLGLSVDGD